MAKRVETLAEKSDLNDLQSLVQMGADSATFNYSKRHPSVDSQQFRQYYESSLTAPSPYHTIPPYWYLWADTDIPQPILTELMERLERLLPARLDQGGVCFLPGRRFGPVESPSVEEIACRLVRGAALQDARRTVALFHSWLAGAPMKYSQVLVLSGFKVSKILTVRDGVRLEPLPEDPAKLIQVLPRSISERVWGDPQRDDLPGTTVLVVDHEIKPVFPVPSQVPVDRGLFEGVTSSMPAQKWDSLLLALSLSCDVPVASTYAWTTADPLASILIGNDVSTGFGYSYLPSLPMHSTYVATQADALQSDSLLDKIIEHRDDLQVAITRWVKSKTGSISDRLIDMRIVLESLYGATTGSGEFTFRVATTGSWHLACNVDERVEMFNEFTELYREASAVIHGRMASSQNEELVKLLDKCSSACRSGILKILDEGIPDWKRLRLGGGVN